MKTDETRTDAQLPSDNGREGDNLRPFNMNDVLHQIETQVGWISAAPALPFLVKIT